MSFIPKKPPNAPRTPPKRNSTGGRTEPVTPSRESGRSTCVIPIGRTIQPHLLSATGHSGAVRLRSAPRGRPAATPVTLHPEHVYDDIPEFLDQLEPHPKSVQDLLAAIRGRFGDRDALCSAAVIEMVCDDIVTNVMQTTKGHKRLKLTIDIMTWLRSSYTNRGDLCDAKVVGFLDAVSKGNKLDYKKTDLDAVKQLFQQTTGSIKMKPIEDLYRTRSRDGDWEVEAHKGKGIRTADKKRRLGRVLTAKLALVLAATLQLKLLLRSRTEPHTHKATIGHNNTPSASQPHPAWREYIKLMSQPHPAWADFKNIGSPPPRMGGDH